MCALSKGVELSPEGRRFYYYALYATTAIDAGKQAVQHLSETQREEWQIGVAITNSLLPFDLVAFMQNETAKFETPDSGTIIAHKDSGINSLKDLKGKKIAVLTKGSQNTVDALYLIKKAGVDITTITLIEATFATHFDLLNSKQVDATITVDPFSTQIMTKGIGKLLSYNYIDSNPGQPLGAWWAKRAAIDKNPEVYKAFALAIKDAIDYLHEDEKRARQIVAEYTGLEASLIEKMPIINWNYKIDPSIWQKEFEILVEMGALKQMPKTEDYFHDLIKEYIKK